MYSLCKSLSFSFSFVFFFIFPPIDNVWKIKPSRGVYLFCVIVFSAKCKIGYLISISLEKALRGFVFCMVRVLGHLLQ